MDKPQNSEKLSGQDYFARMRVLSGIKPAEPITEGKKEIIKEGIFEPYTLIKESVIKGADGKNYGIIKENHKYFIKNATGKKDKTQLDESDFTYIGGLGNKLWRRYNSLAEAQKQLNFLMKSLNENFNHTFTINERGQLQEKEVKEVKPGKDIKEQLGDNEKEDEEEPVVDEPVDAGISPVGEPSAEVGGEVTPSEPGVEPSPGLEEPSAELGEPEAGEVPSEEPVGEPVSDEPVADDSGLGDEEGLGGDDELGDLEDDPVELIQSLVGKLSQKVRMTELTPELTKSVLNSVISSLNLSEVDPEDRLAIAKKVKRGGVAKKEMELQEDFGDKVKGTQGMGKGKVTDIGSKSSIPQRKEGFGKSAKGTQGMGKGKLKAEGIDRIGQIVLESLRNRKRFTPKTNPIIESKKTFTSNREDLKSVEKLIESIVKKKDNSKPKNKNLKENFGYEDNMFHKDKLNELGTGIAPNEILPLLNVLLSAGAAIGLTAAAWIASDWKDIKQKSVSFFQRLGKKDTAAKLQGADDATFSQAVEQLKQKAGQVK